MKLVIVESPTKAKTLGKLLGKDYEVRASMGHIRDLPKSGLGVDVEHDFRPVYEVPAKAKKTLNELSKAAEDKEEILLATDPDREGEAISWHLKELLCPKLKKSKIPFHRVVFHELTKSAIDEAFSHSGEIDLHLVDAQQARRVLDRLVGYKLSPLLWKKVRYGLSAGRVQSVAVRLIVERERERLAFVPDEYWSGDAIFLTKSKKELQASLEKFDSKKLEIKDARQAEIIKKDLDKAKQFVITSVDSKLRERNPYPPLKTSTLQQSCANVFGMSASKTMQAAQRLFEKGLITYHRTDSLNLSPQFVSEVRKYILNTFGKRFLPEKPVFYRTKSQNAQEAHEAIRPTNLSLLPKEITAAEERKVYTIIYKKAVECQMNPAIYDQKIVIISSDNKYDFKVTGSSVFFEGWLILGKKLGLIDDSEDQALPDVEEDDLVTIKSLNMVQHFTQPPARYSDASLIKKLEELEIGRPSTYAPTLSTIVARGYVERDGRYFRPLDVAFVVIDLLTKHFPDIVNYDFTAKMEEDLDLIAENKKEWVPVVRDFYLPFEKAVLIKDKELQKQDVTNLGTTGENCPDCGEPLVFKLGKYGKFISCSNYPNCAYAKPLEEDIVKDENGDEVKDFGKCEKCETGVFVVKKGRFGKFLACSNYPKCKNAKPFLEKTGSLCPKCGKGDVVIKKARRKKFYGCSRYPECDYSSWTMPKNRSDLQVQD